MPQSSATAVLGASSRSFQKFRKMESGRVCDPLGLLGSGGAVLGGRAGGAPRPVPARRSECSAPSETREHVGLEGRSGGSGSCPLPGRSVPSALAGGAGGGGSSKGVLEGQERNSGFALEWLGVIINLSSRKPGLGCSVRVLGVPARCPSALRGLKPALAKLTHHFRRQDCVGHGFWAFGGTFFPSHPWPHRQRYADPAPPRAVEVAV